ncbi:MAG: NAD-dependent epimerase/dehydratase family protein [Ignavibacteriae bacterium]|nr:NAD-dependent epimerase/dehydratase family protein [Ignavibacteriota bacterium]
MKILVTGGTGFTGKNLVEYLLKNDESVRVIVRDKSKLGELQHNENLDVRVGNIYDEEVVSSAMKGIEKVFHVAAIYRTSGIPDQVYWDTHVKATELLMEAALKENVKIFVHTSTVGVHGDVGNGEAANENSPFSPGDIYQVTKLEAEKKVHKFHKEKGLPISVIRPTAIYGPGDLRLLKLFKIAKHKISPILGRGKIKYHMVYIDDLIQGFILASEKKEAIGEAFIIGGKEVLSLNELLETIGKIFNKSIHKINLPAKPFQILGTIMEKIFIPLGISPPIYRRRVDFFTKSRVFDISKAQNLLGYKPNTSLYVGLKKTADWYKQQGHLA